MAKTRVKQIAWPLLAAFFLLSFKLKVEAQALFLGMTSAIVPAGQCRVGESYQVKNLPVKRDQGALGYCYGFSLTSALDHLRCTVENTDCSNPAHSLSVVDVIQTGNDGTLQEGGHSLDISHKVYEKGSLALEKCAPYEAIQKKGWNTLGLNTDLIRRLRNSYEKQTDTAQACKDVLELINQVTGLQRSMQEIKEAIAEKTFEAFLTTIALPKECKKQQVPLPKFSRSSFKEPGADQDPTLYLRQAIVDVFKTNRPIIFDFCMEKECANGKAHSVLLHGARLNCCSHPNQTCKFEYHVRDSARIFANEPGDYWVDASFIEAKGYEYSRLIPLSNKDGSRQSGLSAFFFLGPE